MPTDTPRRPGGLAWRRGEVDGSALPAAIRLWLLDNPGSHRTKDVAEALPTPEGVTRAQWTQKVGNALARMARDGAVVREDRDLGYKRPVGHYRLAVPTDHVAGAS